MEALRDLADDFNVRDPRKLYRLTRQRNLDATQAMAFEALKAGRCRRPAVRAGQVGCRGAERPAAGRPHRLQPEHAGEDEVRPGGDGRLHPGGRRGTSLQNENAETVGRATKRATRELTGDDKNFVVTTDLGNKFATLDREKCPRPTAGRTRSARWRPPWRPAAPRWRRPCSRARRPAPRR